MKREIVMSRGLDAVVDLMAAFAAASERTNLRIGVGRSPETGRMIALLAVDSLVVGMTPIEARALADELLDDTEKLDAMEERVAFADFLLAAAKAVETY